MSLRCQKYFHSNLYKMTDIPADDNICGGFLCIGSCREDGVT